MNQGYTANQFYNYSLAVTVRSPDKEDTVFNGDHIDLTIFEAVLERVNY